METRQSACKLFRQDLPCNQFHSKHSRDNERLFIRVVFAAHFDDRITRLDDMNGCAEGSGHCQDFGLAAPDGSLLHCVAILEEDGCQK